MQIGGRRIYLLGSVHFVLTPSQCSPLRCARSASALPMAACWLPTVLVGSLGCSRRAVWPVSRPCPWLGLLWCSLSSSEFSYPLLLPSLRGKGVFVPLRAGCGVRGCAARCPRDQKSTCLALTSSSWCLGTSFRIEKLCFWHQPPAAELFSEKDQKSEEKGWLPGVAARRSRAPPESKAPGNRRPGTSPAGASEALPASAWANAAQPFR